MSTNAVGEWAQLIGDRPTVPPFTLPAAPPRILPMLEILPVQLLTPAVPVARGEEAGRIRLAKKETVIA